MNNDNQLLPKRLAVLVTNDLTGDSRVLKTCESGVRNGFEVIALASLSENTPLLENQGGYKIIRSGNVGQKAKISQSLPHRIFRLVKKQMRNDSRRLVAKALKVRTQSQARSMQPHLESFKPDLIHANDPDTLSLAMSYKMKANYPVAVIYDSHEYVKGVHRPSKGWNDFMLAEESAWIKKVDGIITVSTLIAHMLFEDYGLDTLSATVLNFPSSQEAHKINNFGTVRRRLDLDKNSPLHVYVGAAAEARGIETVVRSLPLLPHHHLCVVTKQNNYTSNLQKIATELAVADRFHLLPYVPANYVSTFISDATAGISPLRHHQNHELACPTKIYEYVHAGLPIISSDLVESKRFITEHEIGLIFQADNVNECANAMRDVVKNREKFSSNLTDELKASTKWDSQDSLLLQTYQSAFAKALMKY